MTRNTAYCCNPCLNKGISCCTPSGAYNQCNCSGYKPCHRPLFLWRASGATYTKGTCDPYRQRCNPCDDCPKSDCGCNGAKFVHHQKRNDCGCYECH